MRSFDTPMTIPYPAMEIIETLRMIATSRGSGATATGLFHDHCIHRTTDITIRHLLTLLINRGRSCPTQRATRGTQHKDSAQIAMENVGCNHWIYCVHFWILGDPGRRRTGGTNDSQGWLCLYPNARAANTRDRFHQADQVHFFASV